MFKGVRAAIALFFAATFGMIVTAPAQAGVLQCAPYARQVSGIQIFGNAGTWWGQAAGKYRRGHEPRIGAVLAFSASRSMPVGHVAMVSEIVSEREVRLNHANWSYRGGIERSARAVDVSPNNDWSDVRVYYGPIGDLGRRSNPAQGFIYPEADAPAPLAPMPTVTAMAAAPVAG